MDDTIASARREMAIEQAKTKAAAGMKRADAIYAEIKAVIDKHKDEMAALCEVHCTNPADIACMIENLTDWHGAIARDVRRECFTGSLEWMA
jgi:hypothetical protein